MNVNTREFDCFHSCASQNVRLSAQFSREPALPFFVVADQERRARLEYFGGDELFSAVDGNFQSDFRLEKSILAVVLPQEVTWQLARDRRALLESAGFHHLKTRTVRRILRRN